jgi:hypothetical protein
VVTVQPPDAVGFYSKFPGSVPPPTIIGRVRLPGVPGGVLELTVRDVTWHPTKGRMRVSMDEVTAVPESIRAGDIYGYNITQRSALRTGADLTPGTASANRTWELRVEVNPLDPLDANPLVPPGGVGQVTILLATLRGRAGPVRLDQAGDSVTVENSAHFWEIPEWSGGGPPPPPPPPTGETRRWAIMWFVDSLELTRGAEDEGPGK